MSSFDNIAWIIDSIPILKQRFWTQGWISWLVRLRKRIFST